MKKIYLLFLLLTSVIGAKAFDVTFSVDMNGTGLSNVSLNGNFNGWCGYCAPMTDANSDGVWEITLPLTAGTYEYKFTANSGGSWENLAPGSSCTVTNFGYTNRSLVVSANVTLPTVCWQSCVSCNQAPPSYPVTFQVDMANVTGFTTPTVNGSFDGWCGNCHPLTDANADGVWETTLSLPAGTYEYKFAYDNWAGQETLIAGSSCTVTTGAYTNRTVTVSAAATLPIVCWASCVACSSVTPTYTVTFRVNMQNQTGFTTPEVNGTFNGWCGNCNPLTDANADGIWETTLTLQAGTYEYKFSADGWGSQENLTPGSSCTVTNNGYTNRALNLTANTTLDVVCWGLCTNCPPPTYPVTFKVDMANQTGFTTPEVNGTFNGWCGNCNPMTDANADGVWETTLNLPAGTYEYKFAADNWTTEESLTPGSSCTITTGAYTNRTLTVGAAAPITFNVTNDGSGAYVFSGAAVGSDPTLSLIEGQTYIFNINASGHPFWINTVSSTGTGNSYSSGITNNGTDNGTITFVVPSNAPATLFYNCEYHAGMAGTINVTDITPTQVLSTVCWGSCSACVIGTPGCTNAAASNYNASATVDNGTCLYATNFNVDMTCAGTTFTNVYITGPWCGWCGADTYNILTDANADGIYNVTLNLAAGNVEYKYMVDNWASQENLVDDMQNGGTCAPITDYANYANRQIVVGTTTNDVYGRCTACQVGVPGCIDVAAVNYNPIATYTDGSCLYATQFNVDMNCAGTAFTNVYVTGPWCGWCGADTYNIMTDANADGIYTVSVNLAAGNVEYKYMVDNWASQENLVDDMQNGASCAPVTDYSSYANRQSPTGQVKNDVYGRCSACPAVLGCTNSAASNYNASATVDNGTCLYATNFNVDMTCAGTAFTNVYITGPWCGWCGAEAYNVLTDANADGIYNVTLNLAAGNVEYKYMVDNWTSQENLVDDMQNGASCAPITDYANYANRQIVVGTTTNDVYGRCTACQVGIPGCIDVAAVNYNSIATYTDGSCLYATQFNVDMNCAGVAFTNVYVTGPWCGWCGAEAYNVMTDANADGIYTVSVNLAAGNVEYKYMVDNWTNQENLVDDMQNGASCAPVTDYANYANRQSPAGQVKNDVYGRCSACPVLGCTNATACNYNALATQDNGTCTFATTWYLDVDADGYYVSSTSNCTSPGAGYTATAGTSGDCNDNNSTVNAGATESCSTAFDDNCNGQINEGCSTVAGDNPSNATSIAPSIWPNCSASNGTLVGAGASASAQTICLTGEDKWHQFVATSEGVSIVVNSTSADILIELQTAAGVLVAEENAMSGLGGETLNHYGLTAGQVYKIGVRNYNSALGTGTYSICAKMLKRGGCDYGPGPYSLCQYFKATWAGAAGTSYTFTFTGVSGPANGNVYTRTQTSDICVLSTVLPTLPYGSTYNVLITNTYTLNNGAGVAETISVPALATCSMSTASQPVTALRTSDRCTSGPRFRGSVVASLPWVCGSTNWRWEFTELDASGNPVGLPITVNRGAASNYINLGSVLQLQNGKTYSVRTAPILPYTGTDYVYGPAFNMCIIGTSGMITEDSQDAAEGSTKDASQNVAQGLELSVYPNPSNGNNIQLMLSGMNTEVAQVRMLDAMGKQIWTNKFNTSELSNTSIELEQSLADGIYFIQIVSGKETISQRFLVKK